MIIALLVQMVRPGSRGKVGDFFRLENGNPEGVAFFRCVLQEDILSLWNRTALDQTTTSRIRDTLKRVLNLPPSTIMEYKTHTDSLRYSAF